MNRAGFGRIEDPEFQNKGQRRGYPQLKKRPQQRHREQNNGSRPSGRPSPGFGLKELFHALLVDGTPAFRFAIGHSIILLINNGESEITAGHRGMRRRRGKTYLISPASL